MLSHTSQWGIPNKHMNAFLERKQCSPRESSLNPKECKVPPGSVWGILFQEVVVLEVTPKAWWENYEEHTGFVNFPSREALRILCAWEAREVGRLPSFSVLFQEKLGTQMSQSSECWILVWVAAQPGVSLLKTIFHSKKQGGSVLTEPFQLAGIEPAIFLYFNWYSKIGIEFW